MAAGDHIYVFRHGGVYAHHGIDMGDGDVIDFNSDNWYTPNQVRRTKIETFANGGEVLIRDYHDFFEQLQKPDVLSATSRGVRTVIDRIRGLSNQTPDISVEATLKRAQSRLGERGFDLLINNCEHFATWCKTGVSDSRQVAAIWKKALDINRLIDYPTVVRPMFRR